MATKVQADAQRLIDALLKLLIIIVTIFGIGFIGALLINALLAGGDAYHEPQDARSEAREKELLDYDGRMREREAWLADDFHGDFGGTTGIEMISHSASVSPVLSSLWGMPAGIITVPIRRTVAPRGSTSRRLAGNTYSTLKRSNKLSKPNTEPHLEKIAGVS
jgi:hypothetical protein